MATSAPRSTRQPLDTSALASALSSGDPARMLSALISLRSGRDRIEPSDWRRFQARVEQGLALARLSPAQFAKTIPSTSDLNYALSFNARSPRAAEQPDNGSPLDIACAHGKIDEIRFWSSALGPSWNPDGGAPPIVWAIYSNQPQALATLLELGADPNDAPLPSDGTAARAPLFFALFDQKIDIAEHLIEAGAQLSEEELEILADIHPELFEEPRLAKVLNPDLEEELSRQNRDEPAPPTANPTRLTISLPDILTQLQTGKPTDMAKALLAVREGSVSQSILPDDFNKLLPALRAGIQATGLNADRLSDALVSVAPDLSSPLPIAQLLSLRSVPMVSGSILDLAAARGRTTEVSFWAQALGPNFRSSGSPGQEPPTALLWSIVPQERESFDQLLKLGANPNLYMTIGAERMTPLSAALRSRRFDLAVSLLESGALTFNTPARELSELRLHLTEAQISHLRSTLSTQLQHPGLDVVARAGASLIALNVSGWLEEKDFQELLPLIREARAKHGVEFTEAISALLPEIHKIDLSFSAQPNRRDPISPVKGNLLEKAVGTASIATIEALCLMLGADFDPSYGAHRPIDAAARYGQAAIVDLLAKLGAQINLPAAAPAHLASPLETAIAGSWNDSVERLLVAGANPLDLSPAMATKARQLLSTETLSRAETDIFEKIKNTDPSICHDGLRQAAGFLASGWLRQKDLLTQTLAQCGFPMLLSNGGHGITAAGDSILRQDRAPSFSAPAGEISEPSTSAVVLAVWRGDPEAVALLSQILGPDFQASQTEPTALTRSISAGRADLAAILLQAGANPNGSAHPLRPLPLALKAKRLDLALLLLEAGAKMTELSPTQIQELQALSASQPSLQGRIAQLYLRRVTEDPALVSLPLPGSIPPDEYITFISSGAKENFWAARSLIDWNKDPSALIESAEKFNEPGLAAYCRLRRALATDNVDQAASLVSDNSLLSSLGKRDLLTETQALALQPGRGPLLLAMLTSNWPVDALLREHAVEAISLASDMRSKELFSMLLPRLPSDQLDSIEIGAIVTASWRLGGAAMLDQLSSALPALSASSMIAAAERLSALGADGAKAAAALTIRRLDRELQTPSDHGPKLVISLASIWPILSSTDRDQALVLASQQKDPALWKTLAEVLGQLDPHSDNASAQPWLHLMSSPSLLSKVLETAPPSGRALLSQAAQRFAALNDDATLASVASGPWGSPASARALALACEQQHRNAFQALLDRANPQQLPGFFSWHLCPPGDAFFAPDGPALPSWASNALRLAGASFDASDLSEAGIKRLRKLAEQAGKNLISRDREDTFSALTLGGALPETAWLPKSQILERSPQLLSIATDEDKNNISLASIACSHDGLALRYAGPLARCDIGTCLLAVKQNPDAALLIHPALLAELNCRPEQAASELAKQKDALDSLNPLRLFAKKAATQLQEKAFAKAREEMEASARAKALDFSLFERALRDAQLAAQDQALADKCLLAARGIRSIFERSGQASAIDLSDLRRLVERNLPEALNSYAHTDPSKRDQFDAQTRSTPNKMLRASLADALTSMAHINDRLDENARVRLSGDAAVLATKASAAQLLKNQAEKDAEEIAAQSTAASAEDQALSSFSERVGDAANSLQADPSSHNTTKSGPQL